MPQNIRMWEITSDNTLTEISSDEISLEQRLEDWLESDISMLDPRPAGDRPAGADWFRWRD